MSQVSFRHDTIGMPDHSDPDYCRQLDVSFELIPHSEYDYSIKELTIFDPIIQEYIAHENLPEKELKYINRRAEHLAYEANYEALQDARMDSLESTYED